MDAKPLSVQLYSLRRECEKDLLGVLKKLSEIGFVAVEPAGLWGVAPDEYRKIVEDLGMVVSSNHGPWPNRDNLNEVIDVAGELGTNLVVSGFGPDNFKSLDAIRKTAETLNYMVDTLREAGLMLALHNHAWEFDLVEGRFAYDILMDLCPRVLCELDTYWAANFGKVNPAEVVAKYRDRTPLLHIKDGSLVKDEPHVAVGRGKMDVPGVIRAGDGKMLRWLVIELDCCATDMMDAVEESYRYLVHNGLGIGTKR